MLTKEVNNLKNENKELIYEGTNQGLYKSMNDND